MKIAVLLAVYNGEKYLSEQIESLLRQSYGDFVIYIHDDGSKDGSVAVEDEYVRKYPDRIKRLDYPPTGGPQNNFLSALSRTDADYYMFCDQDDVWLDNKIELTYKKMCETEEKGKPCAIFSDLAVVDSELRTIDCSFMHYTNRYPEKTGLRDILARNCAAGCTMMINRELAALMIKYKSIDNIYMHDWWGMLIAACLGKIGYINEPLILYRQHEKNQLGASRVGAGKWMKEKLGNVFQGTQLKVSKQGIIEHKEKHRRIAGELLALPGLREEDRAFLSELSAIGEQKKSRRIRFYLKNHLMENGMKNQWKIIFV